MQMWEYMDVGCEPKSRLRKGSPEWRVKTINGNRVEKEILNIFLDRVGQLGWELVSTTKYGIVMHLFLKRPIE